MNSFVTFALGDMEWFQKHMISAALKYQEMQFAVGIFIPTLNLEPLLA